MFTKMLSSQLIFLFLPLLVNSGYHRFQFGRMSNNCQCVPEHLCENDEAVFGHGLLDPRMGNKICDNPKEICCDPDLIVKEDYEENANEIGTSLCGIRGKSNIKTRITSESTASFGELPWNLIVQEVSGDKEANIYKCGASLIHPKVALTAAHCMAPYVEEPEKIIVRAGEWDVNSRDEPLPFQDNYVEEIVIYKDYSPFSFKNDIALLILIDSFELTKNVGIVCLPSYQNNVIENECVVSGWGKNSIRHGKYSSILKKIQVPIVLRNQCQNTLRNTRLGPRFNLHRSFICAGGTKGQDSCKGDGGGPLICPVRGEKDKVVQVGIVSWGIGCGEAGIPGVYVNVSPFVDWIDQELTDRDLDPSYYKL